MTEILNKYIVPTGEIMTAKGDKGVLEFLSVRDYGKNSNIKAEFLGITKDINGVPNGETLPFSEKWVITISTQYGCSMNCKFCDVPKVGKGINVTFDDLKQQVITAIKQHPEVECTKRLNIHYARMGEPTFNINVLYHAAELMKEIRPYLGRSHVHPVVSTMMPNKNKHLMEFLNKWCDIKNYTYRGAAGLQFSINSTDDKQRQYLFSGNSLSLDEISKIGKLLPNPVGRKYALNFALSDESIIDSVKLNMLFNPEKFMVKITPLHNTQSCKDNSLQTSNGYESFTPYKEVESQLKNEGFDVIIFVPSYDEENGLITCGNAVLSNNKPILKQ